MKKHEFSTLSSSVHQRLCGGVSAPKSLSVVSGTERLKTGGRVLAMLISCGGLWSCIEEGLADSLSAPLPGWGCQWVTGKTAIPTVSLGNSESQTVAECLLSSVRRLCDCTYMLVPSLHTHARKYTSAASWKAACLRFRGRVEGSVRCFDEH